MYRRAVVPCALALLLCLIYCAGCTNAKDTVGAPGKVTDRQPVESASDVPVTADLKWGEAVRADSYNVYFGTDPVLVAADVTSVAEFKGNQTTLYFDPVAGGNLQHATTYYWRVDTVNALAVTKGEVWSFTTQDSPGDVPNQVTGPDPSDGASSVAKDEMLFWAAAGGAASYDVYVGTNLSAVISANAASPEFMGNQPDSHYVPAGNWTYLVTYYWRVDSVNSFGTTAGTVWCFTALPTESFADFTAWPTSGPAPLNLTFVGASTGVVTTWEWDFENDGTVDSTLQNPTHVYTSPGSYTVKLSVTGPDGWDEEIKADYITVYEPLVADFSASTTAGVMPLDVTFTDESTGLVTSWEWDFDNNGVVDSTAQNPTHTYASPGTYAVKLSITGPGGSDEVTKTDHITVYEPPDANFTSWPASGLVPLSVAFTDASTGTVASWEWDFDNNGVVDSTVQNPTYLYAAPGTYAVKLTVDGPGGSDSEIKTGYVTVYELAVADFTASTTSGIMPLAVTFTDASTGTITSWEWDFDNNGVVDSTAQNPTCIYSGSGTYTVRLSISGPSGSDEDVKIDYITVYEPPGADFAASPTAGLAPLTVTFTDATTGTATSWEWDFDNNSVVDSTAQNPTYIYNNPGTYTVKLTVDGPGGTDTVTKTDYIAVYAPADADFTASTTSGVAPLNVTFTDASTGTIASWEWDFDNNGVVDSTAQNPTHIYTNPGTYTVKLGISGPSGSDTEVKVDYITVYAVPAADFTAAQTSGLAPFTATFTDTSTGATTWQWDFDNNGVVDSTLQNPVYLYAAPGTYTVKLTVDGPGGTDTETKVDYITVHDPVSITTTLVTTGIEDAPYYFKLEASGGGGSSYEWSLVSGELPPGVVLYSTGILSGTPTSTGRYTFTVNVRETTIPSPGLDSDSKQLTLEAKAWHWAVELSWTDTESSSDTGPAESPHCFADANDICHAAWAVNDGINPRYIVYAQKAATASVKIYDITDGITDCKSPRVVVDGGGTVHITYLQDDGGVFDLMYTSGTPGSWSSPVAICSDDVDDYDLAIDDNDVLHVSYVVSSANKELYYSTNSGSGWSAQEQVATGTASTCVSVTADSTMLAGVLWSRTGAATDATVCYKRDAAVWSQVEVTASLASCNVAAADQMFHIIWTEASHVYYASLTGALLSGSLQVSEVAGVSGPVEVTYAYDGIALVSWLSTSGIYDKLAYAQVKDGQRVCSPFNLTDQCSSHTPAADVADGAFSNCSQGPPYVVFSKSGTLYITYATLLPASYPEPVTDTAGVAVFANGTCDSGGTYHVAFTDNSAGPFDIYYLSKNGTWSSTTNLSNSGATSTRPHVLTEDGTVYVVWFEFVGPGDAVDVLWRSKPPGGAWSGVQTAFSGTRIPGGFASCYGTSMIYMPGTPNGQFYLFWSAYDGVSSEWRIYGSIFDITTTAWTAPAIVGAVGGRDCFFADAALASDGTIHLAWGAYGEKSVNPTDGFIYYSSYDGFAWTAPAEISGNAADTKAHQPVIAVDSSCNCHVLWTYQNTKTVWSLPGRELHGTVIPSGGVPGPVQVLDTRTSNVNVVDVLAVGGYVVTVFSTVPGPGCNDDMLAKIGTRNGTSVTWQETAYLGQTATGSYNPALFWDETTNTLNAVWNDGSGSDYDLLNSSIRVP